MTTKAIATSGLQEKEGEVLTIEFFLPQLCFSFTATTWSKIGLMWGRTSLRYRMEWDELPFCLARPEGGVLFRRHLGEDEVHKFCGQNSRSYGVG